MLPLSRNRRLIDRPPDLIVGAGPLTSNVWRSLSADEDRDYLFDLRSHNVIGSTSTGLFRASDLRHFGSLLHVLARELLHNGGMSRQLRAELEDLLRVLPAPRDVEDDEPADSSTVRVHGH